jgi:hypothetical protein
VNVIGAPWTLSLDIAPYTRFILTGSVVREAERYRAAPQNRA